jgi:3-oxoacyl-[acyl-carrier-protein] synthase-1
MIYIEGYALCSALGKDIESSVEQLKIDDVEPMNLEDANKYFEIKERQDNDYYDIMEEVATSAIEDAKLNESDIKHLGLFIGTSSAKLPLNESSLRVSQDELLEEVNVPEIGEILTERLNIKGFSTLISTACTSSANALVQAKEMIESGLINKALVLGVELYNELSIKGFDSFLLLSKDKVRPFDKHRDGVILGEGVSAVVLGKKKSHFELCSGAVQLDTGSITSPSVDALVNVMLSAIKQANIETKDISLIKAHATATIHNDAVEADAINELFSSVPKVLSFKPYIGHTMGACGTNELVLLMESLKENFIPKTPNFLEIDPEHPLEPTLTSSKSSHGYSLLNYFGFGGNNCCLVLKYDGK